MTNAKIDENRKPTLTAVSSVDNESIVVLWANPTTHALLVDSIKPANAVTVAASATTFPITSDVVTVTGDAGGNTIATITGGVSGQRLTLIFVDNLVTITDTSATTANTVNLSAAFTGAANTTLTLVYNGNKWFEVSRSAN